MDNLLQRTATACEKDPEKTFTYERHSRIHHFRLEKDEDEQRYVLHFGGNTQPIQTIEHIQTALYDTIKLPKKRAYLKERFLEDLARELETHERKIRKSEKARRPSTPAPLTMRQSSDSKMTITRSSTAEEIFFAGLWNWVTKRAVQPVQAVKKEVEWSTPPETIQQQVREAEGLEDRLHQAAINAQRLQQMTPDKTRVIEQWKLMTATRT